MNNLLDAIIAAKLAGGGGGGGSGLTEDVKQALMDVVNNVAWINGDGQQYIDELEAALYPLSYITADYTQSGPVYTTDSLDSLKADLVVTAFYQGGTSKTVTGYTLSGTLIEGTSTITVSYGGKAATFNVVVTGSLVPDGYVRDGLIFFLDGKQQVDISNGTWTDIVGGKTFSLTDCSASNGVVFNGTSSNGLLDGAVTHDWQNETIELALDLPVTNPSRTMDVFCQPDSEGLGISMRLVANGADTRLFGMVTGLNGITAKYNMENYSVLQEAHTISVAGRNLCVVGGNTITSDISFTPSKLGRNMTGIGARVLTSDLSAFFPGTIYAIRIYNRKLSVDEMIQNQQVDKDRYGL